MPPEPRVTVVVLSHNRPKGLERALASVVAQTHRPAQILLVDNRSQASAEIAAIAARFPEVTLVANPANTGFTGGTNLGLNHASEPWVLITEDDLVLDPDCVAEFLVHAQARPASGAFSGIIVDDENNTILSAGGAARLRGVYRLDLVARGEPYSREKFTAPYDVEYIPGVMFARLDVWRRFGGFRANFFAYGEDIDFCLRLQRAGFHLTVIPSARIRHLSPGPGGGGPSPLIADHQLKNFFALYLLHARPWVWPEVFARYVVLGFLRADGAGRHRILKSLSWNLRHLFELIGDRGREHPAEAGRVGQIPA